MRSRLPDNYKSLVTQGWMKGEQRDKIAADNGLSAGSVTNIVNDFRAALGFPTADALRELGITLRRLGITPAQCASGFRIATLMHRIGVKEDGFESFMSDVYNCCKDIGLSPQNIAFHLADLLDFSKTVSLSKIPDYLKEKTTEKGSLEEKIGKLKEQIETLQQQKKDAESLRDIALQDEKMTSSGLKWYTDLREELRKYGIPIDDIQQFAKAMKEVKQLNYNIKYITTCLMDFQTFGTMQAKLQEDVRSLTITKHDLEEECDRLEEVVSIHSQTAEQVQELKKQGFSFKDLKQLSHTIKEIANANSILETLAVKKFITDIEQQYDDKLGFETKIEKLKYEISDIERDKQIYAMVTTFFNSVTIQQMQYIIQLYEQIKKITSSVEFGPLIRAANGDNVPVPELKLSLIKAIETVVHVLPPDSTVGILNSAKKALEDTRHASV
jgi:hypothetical protein